MNNLKTLAALAAVMLAGLAAPMAAADSETCPTPNDLTSLQVDGGSNSRTLADSNLYTYAISALAVPTEVSVTQGGSSAPDVEMKVWKQDGASCVVIHDFSDGDSAEFGVLAEPANYFVAVKRTTTDSEAYTIERHDDL